MRISSGQGPEDHHVECAVQHSRHLLDLFQSSATPPLEILWEETELGARRFDAGNAKPAVSRGIPGSRCEHLLWGNHEGVRGWRRGMETTASQCVRTAQRSLA